MGHDRTDDRHRAHPAVLGICATALALFLLVAAAQAAPTHPRKEALDTTGLSHACGAAVDSKGDLYLSSAGDSKIKVYNAAHTLLTEISDSNQPCGLAVTTTGSLYVTERATGEVVRFKPNAYPFAGTPTYGSREVIDSSTKAKGIAVDPLDSRLYVAEGDRVAVYDSTGSFTSANEVQKVSLAQTTGGTFKLEFGGQKTAAIAFNATAETVKTALAGLSTIGAGNVSVEKPIEKEYLVTFTGTLASTDVAMLVGDSSGLTGGASPKVNITEKVKGFGGYIGQGTLSEASGVATYSYNSGEGTVRTDHYLWVADAGGADHLSLFAGTDVKTLALRREVDGATTPDGSFGFGTAGAYLAADPGNRSSKGECKVVGEQACTAGHLFLYDAAHKALDELDARGEFLDRTANAAFADAEPTAIAIERSGGANDGTVYVTAGSGAGAKALAFGPLKAPSRPALGTPLSHILTNARAVATDSHGDVYAAADAFIYIFSPSGSEIAKIEDPGKPLDLAVDSAGNLYVLDENGGSTEFEVTYYSPNEYPPKAGTTYERRPEPVTSAPDFPGEILKGIAIDPGPEPGEGKDRLFVTANASAHEYDTAENGSGLLNGAFGKCASLNIRESIAVDGTRGIVYIAGNLSVIYAVSEATGECLARFENTGPASSAVNANPFIAVDQSNGHVIEYDLGKGAREYDAAGSFVAEFGSFTESTRLYRVAIDSACTLHEPPLDETTSPTCKEFDPANGNAYVAFDDPNVSHPPYDVTAFGPLDYGPTPPPVEYELTVEKTGTAPGKKVSSTPAGIDCEPTCSAEYPEDTTVTLKAEANPGVEEFLGWSGCEAETVTATEGTCEVWMSEAKEVKAEFKSIGEEFPLKVVVEGPGSGKVTSSPSRIECPSTCEKDFGVSTVTLTAKEDEGSKFVGWSGCDAEPSPTKCEVSITGPGSREVKAKFKIETPLLTVAKQGAGAGTVTGGSGEEPNTINCGTGSGCKHEYKLGAEVTLKAKEEGGSVFGGWEVVGSPGACPGKEPTCVVTMSKAKEVRATFNTLPQATAKQVNPILYTEATLRGEVNPSGLATKYHFEYLTEDEYDEDGESFAGAKSTPVGELEPTNTFVSVKAPLTGLEEGAAYRFRLIAENSVGSGEDESTFETLQRMLPQACPNTSYRFGLSASLPDCRVYELVTPAQTDGLTPASENDGGTPSGSFSNWFTVQREGGAGERLSYFTTGTLPGFEGNGRLDGYRAERGAGEHPEEGWQSALFSPGYGESAPGISHFALQHGIAPDQLYSVWESNPEPETFPETLPHGVYLSTPSGFEVLGQGSLGEDLAALSRYVSAGGAHVIFTSRAHLEEDAPPASTQAVYDRPAGAASAMIVSIPPTGASPSLKAEFESSDATYVGASEDGSAIAFRVGGALYLHRNGATVEVAAAPNAFAGISEDGTRIFFAAATDGGSAAILNACDAEAGPCAGSGAQPPTKIAAAAIFAGVSPDGSHAFFSSTEALTGSEENDNGEKAQGGARNLYAWAGAEVHFIGKLSSADFSQNAFAGISKMNLAAWTQALGLDSEGGRARIPTRSTPSGDAFVFQSHARLTAYDNEGVGEIYRYEPAAEDGERLLCVSCDPSGVPPSADALLEDIRGIDIVPLKAKSMVASLTDSGEEVFFQSFDRLLPEDANDTEDVYEWRTEGSGTPECTRPSGCLALISSGQGETPSFLYAMSADGHDVFVQTKEKLVGADVAGSPSIYDAREGGGIPEPTPSAPCQGDACQGVGTEAPIIPAPATGGAGEGNGEAPRSPARCTKGKHRVKGRCVRRKHHKHRRHRRAHANRGGSR